MTSMMTSCCIPKRTRQGLRFETGKVGVGLAVQYGDEFDDDEDGDYMELDGPLTQFSVNCCLTLKLSAQGLPRRFLMAGRRTYGNMHLCQSVPGRKRNHSIPLLEWIHAVT